MTDERNRRLVELLNRSPTHASSLFNQIDTVVWLVTAQGGSRPAGLIATFVQNASISPHFPRVIVGIAKQHHTWQAVEHSGCFALHLLRPDQVDLVWRFGLQSGDKVDKFSDCHTNRGVTGSPLIPDALALIECVVENRMDSGDRTIYLGGIVNCQGSVDQPPLSVKQMIQAASDEQLSQLKLQREHDGELDGRAIQAWREASGLSTS